MSDASVGLEPGVVLDRYELLCAIARGGMADVWLGRLKGRHGFEKLVAIKTILPEHALENRFQRMFLDEARIASEIDHPNVAKILDLGEWRDCLYLVMEYVDGDSLSRLRRGVAKRGVKMTTAIALRILSDACAGLHAAHELRGTDGQLLGVVHRDVSPQNILVPNNGSVKLIDFGVAKARDRLGDETGAGHTKGKSRYMAPEQAMGKSIDRRSDIFAVGVMAYELFVGSTPYDGDTDMARLHALLTGEAIKSVPNAPHPKVEALIIKALAREPKDRFSTAAELRTAIEDAMVQMRIRATPEDIAAFLSKHTKERMDERKRLVKLAIDLAGKRDSIKDVLERDAQVRAVQDSQQSISDVSLPIVSPPKPGGSGALPADSSPNELDDPAEPLESAAPPPLPTPPPAAVVTDGAVTPPPQGATVSGLTPAPKFESVAPVEPDGMAGDSVPVEPARRKRLVPVVAGVVGVALLVVLLAFAFRRPGGDASASVTPPMTSQTSTATAPASTTAATVAETSATGTAPPPSATSHPSTTAATTRPTARPTATPRPTATTRPTGRPTATGVRSAKPKGSDVVIQ